MSKIDDKGNVAELREEANRLGGQADKLENKIGGTLAAMVISAVLVQLAISMFLIFVLVPKDAPTWQTWTGGTLFLLAFMVFALAWVVMILVAQMSRRLKRARMLRTLAGQLEYAQGVQERVNATTMRRQAARKLAEEHEQAEMDKIAADMAEASRNAAIQEMGRKRLAEQEALEDAERVNKEIRQAENRREQVLLDPRVKSGEPKRQKLVDTEGRKRLGDIQGQDKGR